VELGRTNFDQVVVSEAYIIEVRGYREVPFSVDEIESISVNHNRWNFRDGQILALKPGRLVHDAPV